MGSSQLWREGCSRKVALFRQSKVPVGSPGQERSWCGLVTIRRPERVQGTAEQRQGKVLSGFSKCFLQGLRFKWHSFYGS